MAIETWGAANNAKRHRGATPTTSTTQVLRAAKRAEGLNAMQRDMGLLRLDPFRPLTGTRHLQKVVSRNWPPVGAGDNRPAGWGWTEQQAYARLWEHLMQAQPPRRRSSPINPHWRQ